MHLALMFAAKTVVLDAAVAFWLPKRKTVLLNKEADTLLIIVNLLPAVDRLLAWYASSCVVGGK